MATNIKTGRFTLLFLGMLYVNLNVIAADNDYLEANYYEAGARYHDLTDGFSSWREGYIKGSWQQDANNIWNWEILSSKRFDESGVFVTAGLTHTINEDWYGSLHLSTSSDAFFFPRFRFDAFVNKKFLDEGNLVGTVGVIYEDTRLVNEERVLYLGSSYYFTSPWVLEAAVKRHRSSPGPEYSTRYKVAVTHGQAFDRFIIAKVDWGNEAYQYVTETTSTINIDSTVYSLTWREWIKKYWGINVVGEYYTSDTYDRRGVMFGVFKQF
ncbi:MAG: YaiO family outer membrane beta-barrel protein [Proteobacteria bacterium]|nr:YaiO family outer membrane beta-barrel protein [Pseudomonadota bacterium]